jgi:predicted Zn-dependent protease
MKRRGKLVLFPILAAVVFALFQYFTAHRTVDPETGKTLRGALTDEQGTVLGLEAYQEVLATERVVESGPEAELVRRVAERLVNAVGNAGTGFEWHVSLVANEQANAFCLPGGKMIVHTGILPITQSENGLAIVLGHEIAHATLRHGSQRLLRTQLADTLLQGAAVSVSLGDMSIEQQRAVLGALGMGTKVGVLLPFSRDHESEADERGLLYAARAGYDPREAIRFWQRMAQASQQKAPEFISTHPSHGTRIERLEAFMPTAMAEYEKARLTLTATPATPAP